MRAYTPDGRFKHYEVIRKGSQIGVTMCKVGEVTHGCIHGGYPQGVIIYFPNKAAVELFSVSRFKPFIEDNPETVGRHLTGPDRIDFRKIGASKVYFLGGTATTKIGGQKKDAMAVRSHSADWVLLDERDVFDEDMATQVDQRLGNSKINRRTDMGTPSIPEVGVDLLYKKSDQRRWQIRCEGCGRYTCLETEFPMCVVITDQGGHFKCSHCGKRIYTNNGSWEPDYKDRDVVGYWPSQLLNPNLNVSLLMKKYEDPAAYSTTEGELKRTSMGEPHIDVQDELMESDVLACQGRDAMAFSSKIKCAMGVDVGSPLYAVIGYKLDRGRYKIIKLARVPDWNALHDLAKKFSVKIDVIDAQPEKHRGREFQKSESHGVFLCYYSETQRQEIIWTPDNLVKVLRNEVFDATHRIIKEPGVLTIPRLCDEVKIFANQVCKDVRALEKDKRTGDDIYRYRRRGDKEDHYRNALNYFYLACKKMGIAREVIPLRQRKQPMQDTSFKMRMHLRKGA